MAGLFDYQSPENMRAARLQPLLVSGAQMGQQPLLSQLVSQMSNAGANIGATGAGMLGLQLPEEARQQQVQSIMQGVDLSSPEGLMEASKRFSAAGLPEQALKANDMAMARAKLVNDAKPKAPETTKLAKYMEEQSKYPVGSPGFVAYQGAIDKETAAAESSKSPLEKKMDLAKITDPKEREAIAKKSLDLELKANQGDPIAAATLALMTKQLEFQILQQKVNQAEEDKKTASTAKVQSASAEAYKTNNILGTITKAIGQTGGNTAGVVGAALKQVPGTEAVDLEQNLLTIKANIGFNELTQMRKDSPTGGALGQVSDMENKALQAARGSLEQAQSPGQLRENLKSIEDSYDRWLKVITGEWTEVDAQNYLDSLKNKKAEQPKVGKVVPTAEQNTLIQKYLKVN
jgi:hypothetical protein